MKSGPERDVMQRYDERARAGARALGLLGPELREIDKSRARRTEDRKAEEAKAILAHVPTGAVLVVLDERGAHLTSPALAQKIALYRDEARPACVFVIGGADGLDSSVQRRATQLLAFGALTWPHQMVRMMLSEQIYRVTTILAGHPYHRQ